MYIKLFISIYPQSDDHANRLRSGITIAQHLDHRRTRICAASSLVTVCQIALYKNDGINVNVATTMLSSIDKMFLLIVIKSMKKNSFSELGMWCFGKQDSWYF